MAVNTAQKTNPPWLPAGTQLSDAEIARLREEYIRYGNGLTTTATPERINKSTVTPEYQTNYVSPTAQNPARAKNEPPKQAAATFNNILSFTLNSMMAPITNEQPVWNAPPKPILSTPQQHFDALTLGSVFTSKDLVLDPKGQAQKAVEVFTSIPSNVIGIEENRKPTEERIRELSLAIQNYQRNKALETQTMQVHEAKERDTRDNIENQETRQLELTVGDVVYGFRNINQGDRGVYSAWMLREAGKKKKQLDAKKQEAQQVRLPSSGTPRGRTQAGIAAANRESGQGQGGKRHVAG